MKAAMRLTGIMLLIGVSISAVEAHDWRMVGLAAALFLIAGGFRGLFDAPL